MKTIIFSCIFLFLFFQLLIAQSAKKDHLKIEKDSKTRSLKISFEEKDIIYNLLVRVYDNTGRTIFLDNQFKFSGTYNQTVDLTLQGKGTYLIEVTKDQEQYLKKLHFR